MKIKSIKMEMFALIIVLVLLTLAACSTSNHLSRSSSVSSQSELTPPPLSNISPSEQESQPTSEESPHPEEDGPFKAFADKLRDTYHDELVDLLNQWLDEHRNGTFKETPNHHPTYPSDFPSANNLPELKSINDVVIAWREAVQLDANTEEAGGIFIVVPIDEKHIYILEPFQSSDEEGKISIGFAYSGFDEMSIDGFFAHSKTQTWREERVYYEGLSEEDERLYQTLTRERGLEEWQIHSLASKGFTFQDIMNLSDEEIAEMLAPGASFMGDHMTEEEFSKLVDSGISEDNAYVLMALGYDYNSAIALTPGQIDFIFPNTELVDNLVALGYDRDLVKAAGFLYVDGGYETYKELLDEVFAKYPNGTQ